MPNAVVELDDEREADGDLGGGHRQDEQEHDLAVRLPPARAATTNARPAALSMISIDIRMKMMLRRTSTPSQAEAEQQRRRRIKPCVSGYRGHPAQLLSGSPPSEVIGTDEARSNSIDASSTPSDVGAEQRDAHLPRVDHRPRRSSGRCEREHGDQLDEEHERQHQRADPRARRQPTALLIDGPRPRLSIIMTKTKSTMMAPA